MTLQKAIDFINKIPGAKFKHKNWSNWYDKLDLDNLKAVSIYGSRKITGLEFDSDDWDVV